MVVLSVSKSLNRVEKIPICVALNSVEPEGFTVHVIGCVIFVCWGDSK